MFEALVGLVGKILSAAFDRASSYAKKRWFRPSIETSKAARNIFEHLQPTVSRDRVKELLGSPHRVAGETWGYRFNDAMVQIEFWDGGPAKSVALALTIHSPKAGFKVPMIDRRLGQLTLEDAMSDRGEFEYRSSLRTDVADRTRLSCGCLISVASGIQKADHSAGGCQDQLDRNLRFHRRGLI